MSPEQGSLEPAIVSTDGVLGGAWRIAGTRIAVELIQELAREVSPELIAKMYPHLTREQIDAALAFEVPRDVPEPPPTTPCLPHCEGCARVRGEESASTAGDCSKQDDSGYTCALAADHAGPCLPLYRGVPIGDAWGVTFKRWALECFSVRCAAEAVSKEGP